MTSINLLPWREELREERRQRFFVLLGVVAASAVFFMILVHMAFANRIGMQNNKNRFLEKEIVFLDKRIQDIKHIKEQKTALIARMKIIEQLQTNRPKIVHLFDEIVKILPRGVYLDLMVREGDVITLKGMTESNTNVSGLMRKISASEWLAAPLLTEVKADDSKAKRETEFTLRLLHLHQLAVGGLNL